MLASSAALLAGATDREPLVHGDSKSGARLERVVIDGDPFVAKWLDARTDWTMRAAGDLGGSTLQLWSSGLLDALPTCFEQPIVGVAREEGARFGGYGTVLLMRDVGRFLVPEGDMPLSRSEEAQLLDHMAALHAHFWGFVDRWELIPVANRYCETSPLTAEVEAAIGSGAFVPGLIREGWDRFADVAPEVAGVVLPLAHDPTPLAAALDATPATFVHGNWKLGNLGLTDDGRTVLIDWESPGPGPPLGELAWYLALNCRRLAQPKEAVIDDYRAALERRGVATDGWWDRQLGLCLLGGLVMFGWEKVLGGRDDELEWWIDRASEGTRWLH